MTGRSPSVFVCYSHDSASHKRDVLRFSSFLVSRKIHVCLDQWYEGRRQDWYKWMLDEIPRADFVLAIASWDFREAADGRVPAGRNLGLQAEASLLRELLQSNRPEWTERILPVVLPGHGPEEIPFFLQPLTADHYIVESFTDEGADSLLRALHSEPSEVRPAPGRAWVPGAKPDAPVRPGHPSGNVQHIVSSGSGAVYANQNGDQTIHR